MLDPEASHSMENFCVKYDILNIGGDMSFCLSSSKTCLASQIHVKLPFLSKACKGKAIPP